MFLQSIPQERRHPEGSHASPRAGGNQGLYQGESDGRGGIYSCSGSIKHLMFVHILAFDESSRKIVNHSLNRLVDRYTECLCREKKND